MTDPVTLSDESIAKIVAGFKEVMLDIRSKPEENIDIATLSDTIHVPVRTIRSWLSHAKRNKFPYSKPGKCYLFQLSKVRSWMESR